VDRRRRIKKKEQLHDQGTGQASNQGTEVTYVQNGEQQGTTIWQRIQRARSKDELYKLYGTKIFDSLIIDGSVESDLANFIIETRDKGPKFSNYSRENLESFVERIYELRKNQSNNTTR
jgi:hypothetical protein